MNDSTLVARRQSGEGTLSQRKDGTWSGAVRYPNGKRKWVYGKSRERVERRVAALIESKIDPIRFVELREDMQALQEQIASARALLDSLESKAAWLESLVYPGRAPYRRAISAETRDIVITRHGMACAYCGVCLTQRTFTVDHIVPVIQGGSNRPDNLVPACRRCNSAKSGRTPAEARMTFIWDEARAPR